MRNRTYRKLAWLTAAALLLAGCGSTAVTESQPEGASQAAETGEAAGDSAKGSEGGRWHSRDCSFRC